jgi:putative inorganic carbon (HCO3(-)) transporter
MLSRDASSSHEPARLARLTAAIRQRTPAWAMSMDWPVLAAVFLVYSQFPEEWRPFDADPLIALTVLTLALRAVVLRDTHRDVQPAALYGLLYLAVAAASITWAADGGRATAALLRLAKDLGLFLVLAAALARGRTLTRAGWVIVAVGIMVTAGTTYQRFSGRYDHELWGFARVQFAHLWGEVNGYRVTGTLSDPNFFAQSLFPVVGIAFGLLWTQRRPALIAFAGWAAVAALGGIALTYSRGAVVALAVVMPLLVVAFRPLRRSAAMVALVAALALPFLTDAYTRRLLSFGKFAPSRQQEVVREPGFKGRTSEMMAAMQMFRDHPLGGVGLGNYEAYYRRYAAAIGIDKRTEDRQAHSLPLEIAAETGIIGVAAFSLLLLSIARRIYQARVTLAADSGAPLATGIAIGLAGYLTTSLFLHDGYQRQLWVIAAMAYASPGLARRAAAAPAA